MKKFALILITIILTAMAFAKSANSQLILPSTLSLKTAPTSPLPNSAIVATAMLIGSDTANATYAWFLNNVRQSDSSGIDKNTFSFQTGKLGSVYTVSVSVTTGIGENLRDSISFTVSDADLTWNAQNQAPADYEGKILPSEGTKIIASVLPIVFSPGTKTQLNPSNLTYRWFLNNIFDSAASGLGKSVFKYSAGTNSDNLKVQISNTQNTVIVEKAAVIPVVQPKILVFVSNKKGEILYKSAATNLTVKPGNAVSLKTVPYFFNLLSAQLNWSWFVNNEKVSDTAQQPWLATFNIPANTAVPANFQMSVTAINPFYGQENASSLINITTK